MNGWGADEKKTDAWTYRIEIFSKLVANVGFPIIVSSALLLVLYRALPVLDSLNSTMQTVSATTTTLNASINLQIEHEQQLEADLRSHDERMVEQQKELELMDRKADQYHQDFMLGHSYPEPGDPPRPRRRP